ncbi:MAG: hypothetical protein RLN90_01805 [Balneolaceae bacterium]
MKKHPIHISICLCIICLGCNSNSDPVETYFFLDGYPELVFTDSLLNPVLPVEYIRHVPQNGISTYIVNNHSLDLRYRKSKELYSGFIRTYHWGVYNIEAIFDEGKIKRLRYWHPNRQLAMDMDFETKIGSAWNNTGVLLITWDGNERQYRNPSTNKIRQITNDSISYYFDFEGELNYYTFRNDTAFMQFYGDGSPRFLFPIREDGIREGEVKRWHRNGQVQVIGQYKDGKEFGTWIEYDSLGNEVERQSW